MVLHICKWDNILISYVPILLSVFYSFYLLFSFYSLEFVVWVRKKRSSLQDAMGITLGDDADFEGCDNSSDKDPEDPNYTPNDKDMGIDESSEGDDSDRSESSDLDEVPHPKMNPGQQTQLSKDENKELCEEKKTIFLEKETVWSPWVHI